MTERHTDPRSGPIPPYLRRYLASDAEAGARLVLRDLDTLLARYDKRPPTTAAEVKVYQEQIRALIVRSQMIMLGAIAATESPVRRPWWVRWLGL